MRRIDISPEEIITALMRESRFAFERTPNYLKGLCPECGKKELFISCAKPWVMKCNRLNKCGFSQPVRELLHDLFDTFAERHPATEENRDATASAYLGLNRGFDLSRIRGWYEQAAHHVPNTTLYIPTVRFYLDQGRTRYWERLLGKGPSADYRKAHFGGKRKADGTLYKGDVWAPPGFTLERGDICYITEGIFHAIALSLCGYKAASAMSANTYPADFLAAHAKKGVHWIWALDSGTAGERYAKVHHATLKQAGELSQVLLLPPHKDWDDLYRDGAITPAFIADRLYYGRLFLAKTVEEKAYHAYVRHRRPRFQLDFDNALFAITLAGDFDTALTALALDFSGPGAEGKASAEKTASSQPQPAAESGAPPAEAESSIDAALKSPEGRQLFIMKCGVDQISNVLPEFLYMERDELMDEQSYVFSIAYANGQKTDRISLDGTSIASPDAFHKALLGRSRGGTFDGDMRQLKILRDRWLNHRMLTVTALPFVGYDRSSEAYIFQNHAFHKGRRLPINEQGYFKIGQSGIKTALNGVYVQTDGGFSPGWLGDFVRAFHWQGLAVLAFWLGSLFVQQIRARHKTYPFLELTGEPGSGKSTILEFLWKCVGRDDYEGFDLLKSTPAGRRRAFSQVSNLPVVIIESDRDSGEKDAKQKQFGFDEVKPFFNGRGTGTLGVARRSNDVEEHLFQASMLISQNAEVDGSEALLQRIVHCHADKKHHGPGTRETARWFERQTTESVGGFLGTALAREHDILAIYEKTFPLLEEQFAQSIKIERLAKNHAQIAACGHALSAVFGTHMTPHLQDGLTAYLRQRGTIREQRLAADHPLVEQFWEQFEYLNAESPSRKEGFLNHAGSAEHIAVNLIQFREAAQSSGQPLLDMHLLKKLLPGCKRYKFLEANKAVRSKHINKTIKCWVFQTRHK